MAGETGSGKSTQLPKLCLELGRTGDRATRSRGGSPRARSPSGSRRSSTSRWGRTVGYAVRFDDRTCENTRLRLVTDGLLLAEIARDRLLRRYDTIIVDEAHERSLNVDFLLGYLKRLLPERPDLKVIITLGDDRPAALRRRTSDGRAGGRGRPAAPIPVETRYRPLEDEDDPADAIADAVDERCRATCSSSSPASARSATPRRRCSGRLRDAEILPLYARLSTTDQQKRLPVGGRAPAAGSCSPPTSPRRR